MHTQKNTHILLKKNRKNAIINLRKDAYVLSCNYFNYVFWKKEQFMKKKPIIFAVSLLLAVSMLMPTVYAAGENKDFEAFYYTPDFRVDTSAMGAIMPVGADEEMYISPYLPAEVRDQGSWGTCWCFATAALAEISLIKQEKAEADKIDLSEAQLVYNVFNEFSDPLGNLGADKTTPVYQDWLTIGGNVMMTSLTLAAWKGITSESEIPYKGINEDFTLTPEQQAMREYILTNARWLNMSNKAVIKANICQYGAVSSAYYHDDSFMNEDTGAYYSNVTDATNHAVTIVGWDDNYSASNFAKTPAGNGAWICRNSWTEYWGNDGYFYLSYYDTSIMNSDAFAIEMDDADEYDYNYQYDGTTGISSLGLPNGITVFNTYKASGAAKEELSAVGIGFLSCDIKYSIQIYDVWGKELLEEEQVGYITDAGYYTIELDEEIKLEKGDEFSVAFTLEALDPNAPYVNVMTESSRSDGHFSYNADNTNAKSYYAFGNILNYYDVNADYGHIFRIKAFTEADSIPHHVTINGVTEDHVKGDIISAIASFYKYVGNIIYRFNHWESNVDVNVDDRNNEISFDMPDVDCTIDAVYTKLGDINLDDNVNIQDLFECKAMLTGAKYATEEADINYDGNINIQDLFGLKSIMTGGFTPK